MFLGVSGADVLPAHTEHGLLSLDGGSVDLSMTHVLVVCALVFNRSVGIFFGWGFAKKRILIKRIIVTIGEWFVRDSTRTGRRGAPSLSITTAPPDRSTSRGSRIKVISLRHGTVKEIYQAVEGKIMQWDMTWSKAKVKMRSREVYQKHFFSLVVYYTSAIYCSVNQK